MVRWLATIDPYVLWFPITMWIHSQSNQTGPHNFSTGSRNLCENSETTQNQSWKPEFYIRLRTVSTTNILILLGYRNYYSTHLEVGFRGLWVVGRVVQFYFVVGIIVFSSETRPLLLTLIVLCSNPSYSFYQSNCYEHFFYAQNTFAACIQPQHVKC